MDSTNQWFFSDLTKGGCEIEFSNPDLRIKITRHVDDYPTVAVFDLIGKNEYWVGTNLENDVLEGNIRPLITRPDGFEIAPYNTWRWISLFGKQTMVRFMRRAVSFRTSSMPYRFADLWADALKTVENLDIINPNKLIN